MLAAPFINYSCVSFRCHKNGEREREGGREREREREKFILLVYNVRGVEAGSSDKRQS